MIANDHKYISLAGALTQYIACDIGINGSQEGFLACALYLTMGIATIIAGPVSNV